MSPRPTLSTRWVTVIVVAALACSAAVVWGLIQITGQSPASSSTSSGVSAAPSSSDDPSSETPQPGQDHSGANDPSATESLVGSQLSGSIGTLAVPTRTPAPVLPGSGLQLPAAWTGTAEMMITVLGRCAATGGTSSYTRSAELALQGPVLGSGPFDDPNPLSMTLGITPTGIPGLALYSASTDESGAAVHRTWWLTTGTGTGPDGEGRTELSGVLIDDQPVRGALPPNLLVDSETDLQPCESGGTVRVPRTLAAGSTVTGWVSSTAAHLDVAARTVDGERAVSAAVDLVRRPGP